MTWMICSAIIRTGIWTSTEHSAFSVVKLVPNNSRPYISGNVWTNFHCPLGRWRGGINCSHKYGDVFNPPSNACVQGGVLSPVLLCKYMDGFLNALARSKVGCYIRSRFYGALCYADNLTLVCQSSRATDIMLHICEEFAHMNMFLNYILLWMFIFQIWHAYVNLSPAYLELLHVFLHRIGTWDMDKNVECTFVLGHPVVFMELYCGPLILTIWQWLLHGLQLFGEFGVYHILLIWMLPGVFSIKPSTPGAIICILKEQISVTLSQELL